jgi:hypothetical protein
LRTIFAFDKSLHPSLPLLQRVISKLPNLLVFSHGLGREFAFGRGPLVRSSGSSATIQRHENFAEHP